MNTIFVCLALTLISVPAFAESGVSTSIYPFVNRFTYNAKSAVDAVEATFGDTADVEMDCILSDLSFSSVATSSKHVQLVNACKSLGLGVIPALDRAMNSPDAITRQRATWMASRMVFIKEDRPSKYSLVETALSWMFCRMVLDVDERVRNEASIGLLRIISLRSLREPIPQGALEGVWLYKLIAPFSDKYIEMSHYYEKFKVPEVSAEFRKIWAEYEVHRYLLQSNSVQQQNIPK